jgi:hypothetical protein
MFSQVLETSAIREHTIHCVTIVDFVDLTLEENLDFFEAELALDFRADAFRS